MRWVESIATKNNIKAVCVGTVKRRLVIARCVGNDDKLLFVMKRILNSFLLLPLFIHISMHVCELVFFVKMETVTQTRARVLCFRAWHTKHVTIRHPHIQENVYSKRPLTV